MYYDSFGKRKEKKKRGFLSEREAYQALLEVKTNTAQGAIKLVEFSNYTIAEWFDIGSRHINWIGSPPHACNGKWPFDFRSNPY
jgi:hypothetical protein